MMKIGCDPEFLPIIDFMKDLPKDPYAFAKADSIDFDRLHDDMSYQYDEETKYGNIGGDGGNNHDDIGELRPKPGNPKQVVSRLKKMIHQLQRKKIIIDLIAGGGKEYQESLGGHIHFDLELSRGDRGWGDVAVGRLPRHEKALIDALDHYIGQPLKKKKGGDRRGTHYGKLSDVRYAEHGSSRGFEYRTPPSWLTSPELAEGVLWTAWAIAQLYKLKNNVWVDFKPIKGKFKLAQLDALKTVCPQRGKDMIDAYGKILKDRKFDLGQKCAITNWTGKKVKL